MNILVLNMDNELHLKQKAVILDAMRSGCGLDVWFYYQVYFSSAEFYNQKCGKVAREGVLDLANMHLR